MESKMRKSYLDFSFFLLNPVYTLTTICALIATKYFICFNCRKCGYVKFWGRWPEVSLAYTLRVGLLVQVCNKFVPHLLVSSQSESVRQQGGGVQVVHLALNCFLKTAQALLYHRVLSQNRHKAVKKTTYRQQKRENLLA